MFADTNFTLDENNALWNKMISASTKARRHADYILDFSSYGGTPTLITEFNRYIDMVNDALDIQAELTDIYPGITTLTLDSPIEPR
jgi:hypothetical protein